MALMKNVCRKALANGVCLWRRGHWNDKRGRADTLGAGLSHHFGAGHNISLVRSAGAGADAAATKERKQSSS
jgi:hypothetical protein